MRLRVLSGADVRSAIGMGDAIAAMRDAFAAVAANRADSPLRTALRTEHGVALFMPAHLPDPGALGAKVVSVFDANAERGLPAVSALVLMLDATTGLPRAVCDGTYLTALRTGAASGLATDLLARADAAVVALFGAGAQARTQLEAVRAVRPIGEVRIVSRTLASAERLAAEVDGVDVALPGDPSAALRGADIVIAATTSATPVFDGSKIEPGTHVNGIGSYSPEMREVDAALIARATVVVDAREAALAEAGDLLIPMRRGRFAAEDVHAELGEIVNSTRPGRRSADEITFFKSVGVAAQDVAIADRALRAAESAGLGTMVEL